MKQYFINNLSEDLEKKLTLYSNHNLQYEKDNFFNHERYEKFVEIIINRNNLDLNYMIKRLENYYKNSISSKDNKLIFNHNEIGSISSKLYSELFYINSKACFDEFLKIIQTKVNGDLNWWLDLSFGNDSIKNHFLQYATDYIIKNQNKLWIEEFEKINYERYSWLPNIKKDKIPIKFEDNIELFFWSKRNRNDEILHFIGNNIVRYLIHKVINLENYNIHQLEKNNIIKILENCKSDYITTAYILTNDNIKLNCFFLTMQEYSIYGFVNLYNIDSAPHNLSDNEYDYTQEWNNMLSKQLINLFFKHFYNLQYKDSFANIIFNLLNFLVQNYVSQYNNIVHTKANKTYLLVLEKLQDLEIKISHYEKTTLLDFVVKELLEKQIKELESNKTFDTRNYYLLCCYIKFSTLENDFIQEIIQKILSSLKENFTYQKNDFYVDLNFITKIDFYILYEYLEDKTVLSSLMNIDFIKQEWYKIEADKKDKITFSSNDEREPRDIVKLYFKILVDIYKKYNDENIAKTINNLAIEFGINIDLDIFLEYSFEKNELFDEYLEILNLFSDELFDDFLEAIKKKNNLKEFLQLYYHTILDNRKIKIQNYIQQIQENITEDNISYFDIRESILFAINNGFRELATTLIGFYKSKIELTNYKHKEKEFFELVCKKELLDIYYSSDKNTEKFNKLYDYKIPFDDKNWGVESKQQKCENYKDFIRAIIFFDTEAEKTYKILENLLDKEINSLYIINMLNAYFKHYENSIDKKKQFAEALEKYSSYMSKISNYEKTLFDYQTLLYGYMIIENETKFMELWFELPKQYQYDFQIFEIRCQFLQQNSQALKAKEYIKDFKKHKFSEDILQKIDDIETKLDENIYTEIEHKFSIKLNTDSLHLSLKDAKNYWLQIKDMAGEQYAQIFSKAKTLNDFIKNIMLDISKELLNRKVNIQRQTNNGHNLEIEDIINDWVTSLLQQKMKFLGWYVKDQTRGGVSSSGKNPGEKDLEVYNSQNEKLFLFEAFRLFSADTNAIKEHINKLDGYNADGCRALVVMAYVIVKDFLKLCNEYQGLLEGIDYDGFDVIDMNKHNFETLDSNSSTIKIYNEIRYKNGIEITIYHFIVDFS